MEKIYLHATFDGDGKFKGLCDQDGRAVQGVRKLLSTHEVNKAVILSVDVHAYDKNKELIGPH